MENENVKNEKSISDKITDMLSTIVKWFISSAFIMWGWNVLAPHINAPQFGYWEIFAMRMGLTYFMNIMWQR